MFTLALSSLEKIINTYLQLDPESVQRLSVLQGKIIKVRIVNWKTSFFIVITKKELKLTTTSKKNPDIIISGNLLNLFKTAWAKGSSPAFFKNQIKITGKTEIGEKIRDILVNINIDWEEYLSKITGDILAHQIGLYIKRTANFGKSALETVRVNIQDHLQNEAQILPSLEEIEHFIQSVTELQYSIDRTEARILRLMRHSII